MNHFLKYIILFLIPVLFQACNTLYNSKIVQLEILEPGNLQLPPDYKNVAIKYNNFNEGFNPVFANYFDGKSLQTDSSSTDSIAAKIYFDLFVENLAKQQFFDTVILLEPSDYSNTSFIVDTILTEKLSEQTDSLSMNGSETGNIRVTYLNNLIRNYSPVVEKTGKSKIIHPELGLYTEKDIDAIVDSTGADLLLSLDFFAVLDAINYFPELFKGFEMIQIMTLWNFYDLKNTKLQYSYSKTDTINWTEAASGFYNLIQNLPPREDAIFNAADITGTGFAEFLVPHWTEVQRMYYSSNQVELQKTEKLIAENRWLEAAEIWKANVNNPNKNIAAKSKFNMGLVCEIEGDFNAALDWVVQSYHELGQKNEIHFSNCQQYIRILSQRMLDVKKIELQYHNVSD
jgi:hypothetical protein